MLRVRAAFCGTAFALATCLATTAHADYVGRGPFPNTATSENGSFVWYTGRLDLSAYRWKDMDAACATVPEHRIRGWRAPTEKEVRTLFMVIHRENGIARWDETVFLWPDVLLPAVPSNLHTQVNLLYKDGLYTYEGQRTTLAQVRPDRMYQVHWFQRWTVPTISDAESMRYHPGDLALGPTFTLLCVADGKVR